MPIHWNIVKEIPNKRNKQTKKFVLVICPQCGKERWWYPPWLRKYLQEKPTFAGRCTSCAIRSRPNYKAGTSLKGDGYILLRPSHFTSDEMAILQPMWPSKVNYIRSNRAVMALHLGRALDKTEIVHHINGNRADDNIENLRLLRRSTHHNGVGDDYYQKWQETLTENKQLKAQLAVLRPDPNKNPVP